VRTRASRRSRFLRPTERRRSVGDNGDVIPAVEDARRRLVKFDITAGDGLSMCVARRQILLQRFYRELIALRYCCDPELDVPNLGLREQPPLDHRISLVPANCRDCLTSFRVPVGHCSHPLPLSVWLPETWFLLCSCLRPDMQASSLTS